MILGEDFVVTVPSQANALEEIEWPIDILTSSNLTYEFFEDCIVNENCKGVKIQQFWPQ